MVRRVRRVICVETGRRTYKYSMYIGTIKGFGNRQKTRNHVLGVSTTVLDPNWMGQLTRLTSISEGIAVYGDGVRPPYTPYDYGIMWVV